MAHFPLQKSVWFKNGDWLRAKRPQMPEKRVLARCLSPFLNHAQKSVGVRLTFGMALLLLAIGCGKDLSGRGEIHGEVRLDGQVLERGSILFAPMQGIQGAVTGARIEKGVYRIGRAQGPAVGWNRVEIRAVRKTGKMLQKPYAPAGEMVEECVEAIAPRFNSASTLKFDVTPGENTANFEVLSH